MKRKNKLLVIILALCISLSCLTFSFGASAAEEERHTVSPSLRYQEIDGWGTSLIWWAGQIGGYDWEGDDSREVREQIMDMIFKPEGLDFNIVRYNVGGGENPEGCEYDKNGESHMIIGRNMEGFKKTENGEYDWEADKNQRWALKWVQENVDNAITEFFSNSPPWFMTESGCTGGRGEKFNSYNNLKPEYEDDFALYFVDVLEHLIKVDGMKIEYINPFNESSSNWWWVGGTQEGCYIDNNQRANIITLIKKLVDERGLDVIISATDCTGAGEVYDAYEDFSGEVQDAIGKLNYHLYQNGDDKNAHSRITRLANRDNGKKTWMSEMGYDYEDHLQPIPMDTAFRHSQQIRSLLGSAQVNSYVIWQIVEELTWQLGSKNNYGPIKVSFFDRESYPGLESMGLNKGSIEIDKQYYVLGQYSKYIKEGYSIIDTGDSNALAAVSPDGKKVVIVRENNLEEEVKVTYSLDGYQINGSEVIFTDRYNNWKKSKMAASGTEFSYTVNPKSVSTFVLDVEQFAGEGYFIDDSNGEEGEEILTENRFFFSSGWSGITSDENDAPAKLMATRYASGSDKYIKMKFDGTGINVYGKRNSDSSSNVKFYIDDKLIETKNLYSANTIHGSVFRFNGLDKGSHTLRIEIGDEKYFNLDGSFVIKAADKAMTSPNLIDAAMLGGKLSVVFSGAENFYNIEYRKEGENNWKSSPCNSLPTGSGEIKQYKATVENIPYGFYEVRIRCGNFFSATKILSNMEAGQATYSVDCGTIGEPFHNNERGGQFNSVKDRTYGLDPVSNRKWGRVSEGNEIYTYDEKVNGYHFTSNELSGDGNSEGEIEYRFETENKNYDVVLTMRNLWDNAPRTFAVEINNESKGNYSISGNEVNYIIIKNVAAQSNLSVRLSEVSGGKPLLGGIILSESDKPSEICAVSTELSVKAENHYVVPMLKLNYGEKIEFPKTAFVYKSNGASEEVEAEFFNPVINKSGSNKMGGTVLGKAGNFDFSAEIKFIDETAKTETPSAPQTNKTEAAKTESITFSGLVPNSQLILTDKNFNLISEVLVDKTSITLDLSELNFDSDVLYAFTRVKGGENDSEIVSINFPSVYISGITDSWSDKKVLRFTPSSTGMFKKLEVVAPSGKRTNIINNEYYYFRATENGEHTVEFTTKNNKSYSQKFTIDSIDTINISSVKNINTWTDGDVEITFEVESKSGVDKVFVNGNLTLAPYKVTVNANGEIIVKVVSLSGSITEHIVKVDNIDKEAPSFNLNPDFAFSAGFKADIAINNISGGTVTAVKGEKTYGTANGFVAMESGEYTLTFTSGANKSLTKKVNVCFDKAELKSMTAEILTLKGKTYLSVSAVEGKSIKDVMIGVAGEKIGAAAVNEITASGKYTVYAETSEGAEVLVLDIELSESEVKSDGCGNSVNLSALALIGAALTIGLTVVLKNKKTSKKEA